MVDTWSEPYRDRKEEAEKRRMTFRKWIKRILVILSSILVLELVFHLAIAPNLRLAKVVYRGDMELTDEELFRLSGLKKQDFYFGLDERTVEKQLESSPAVRKAVVEKVFPDTLRLTLFGRKPLGLALVDLGTKSMAVCFDRDGVVFQIAESIRTWDLPVVSGVKFGTVQLGMKFPDEVKPVLKTLDRLESQEAPLLSLISEIKVVNTSPSEVDLELLPSGFPVRVLVRPDVEAKTLKEMFLLLELMRTQGLLGKVKELDLRTGHAVFPAGERG